MTVHLSSIIIPFPGENLMTITALRPKWKSTLTDRERFNNQMHYKPIDRCFNIEFRYWYDNFELWPFFRENNIHSNEEADVFFNFDRIFTLGGNVWIHPSF